MELTDFGDLKENMSRQITIFNEVLEVNNKFRDSILNRNWSLVNENIDKLNSYSLDINKLDTNRVDILISIIKKIKSKDNENLLSIIQKAPIDQKDILVDTFYKLKSSIIQVQGVFKGLNDFVEYKKELSKEVIDILVKDSKGNVYSKPGRRDQDGQGFLVNTRL